MLNERIRLNYHSVMSRYGFVRYSSFFRNKMSSSLLYNALSSSSFSCRTMISSNYATSSSKSSSSSTTTTSSTEQKEQQKQLTVWYDGACPLCIREISLFARLDKAKHIAFVDLTTLVSLSLARSSSIAHIDTDTDVAAGASAGAAVCPMDTKLMLERFHATIHVTGQTVSGAAAFAAMWSVIPYIRPIGIFVSANPRVLNVLEKLYVLFLKVRPSMQTLARRYLPLP